MPKTKLVVGRAEDFKDGYRVTVDAGNGRQIVVFRQAGAFYGLLNRCPHRGAQLCKGRFVANITSDQVGGYVFHGEDRLLACPWHGWEFDIKTGQSYFDPIGTRARPFAVQIESGETVRQEIDAGETSVMPEKYAARVGGAIEDGPQPGPYRAETFEVTVEDSYVVILLRAPRPDRPPRAARTLSEGAIG